MKPILILSSERIRPAMAGMGIRCWEMATALADDFDVTLGVPNDPQESPPEEGFRLVCYTKENIAALSRKSSVVIALGHVSDLYLDQGERRPLVVDLYDPFPVEHLNYLNILGHEPYYRDRATIERQLRHGDLFLCSSNEQRFFYLGMLFSLGRLNPESYFEDFNLRNLIRIVPFGVPQSAPKANAPVLRGMVPGIGADDPMILFGGLYEWLDPMTLLRALPDLLARFPELRVIFSTNPNPESTPQSTFDRVMKVCREREWIDRHVFFIPWIPYLERAGLYLEATVAVVLHLPRFETEISMRTRILDYLWAGLPIVATEGGSASRLLTDQKMGRVVPFCDHKKLTAVLIELLGSGATRKEITGRGRSWTAGQTWGKVLGPLRDFLTAPRIDPHKRLYPAAVNRHSSLLQERVRDRLRRITKRMPDKD